MYQLPGKKGRGRGFTLVEMLVVVALVLVLGSIALLNLGPRKKVKEFSTTVQRLVHMLDDVRNKSVNFEGEDKWYLVFIKKSCDAYSFPGRSIPGKTEAVGVFFKALPTVNGSVMTEYYPLPASVDFDESLTFPGSGNCPAARYIYFDSLTGVPHDGPASMALKFKVYLVADPSISSTISISSIGLISYTTSSLWSF